MSQLNGNGHANGNGKRTGIEVAALQLLELAAAVGALRRTEHEEYSVLSTLQEHGTLIVGDVGRMTGVKAAQLSRIIGRFQKPNRRFISCTFHEGDRRKTDLALTPAGSSALTETQENRIAPLVQLLRHLTENEQATLCRLLTKLHAMSKG